MPTLDELLSKGGQVQVSPPPGEEEPVRLSPPSPPQAPLSSPSSPGFTPGMKLDQVLSGSPAPLPTDAQVAEDMEPGWFTEEAILSPQAVLSTTGGIAGGAVGSAFPGLGTAVGAGVGAGIGQSIGRGIELLQKDLSQNPMTPKDWVLELGGAGAKGVATEYIGGRAGAWASKIFQRTLAPFADKIDEAGKAVMESAAKLDIDLLASQKRGSGVFAQLEGMPTRFPWGVGPAIRFAEKQNTQMEKAVTDLAESMAPGYSRAKRAIGNYLKSGSQKLREEAKAGAKLRYDAVERIVDPETPWPVSNLYNRAVEIAKEEAQLSGKIMNPGTPTARNIAEITEPTPGPAALLDPASIPASIIQAWGLATEQAKEMPFARIRAIQSRLGDMASNHPNPEARRTFARLYSALDEDLQNVATNNPGLQDALSEATRFYKQEVIDSFVKNQQFKNIQKKDASELVEVLLAPGTTIEEVERIKKILPPEEFEKLGAGWLFRKVGIESRGEVDQFSVQKFLTKTGPMHYDPEVIEAILGKDRAESLAQIRKVFLAIQDSRVGAGNPSMTGRAVLGADQIQQAMRLGIAGGATLAYGGALTMVGANPLLAATTALLTPITFAKVLYSKRGAKYLAEGLDIARNKKLKKAAFEIAHVPTMIAASHLDWPWEEDPEDGPPVVSEAPLRGPDPRTQGVSVQIPQQ